LESELSITSVKIVLVKNQTCYIFGNAMLDVEVEVAAQKMKLVIGSKRCAWLSNSSTA